MRNFARLRWSEPAKWNPSQVPLRDQVDDRGWRRGSGVGRQPDVGQADGADPWKEVQVGGVGNVSADDDGGRSGFV